MILPQVHLRKPCYDFYFLQNTPFACLLGHEPTVASQLGSIRHAHDMFQSVVATGGVYKGQGRNQRELMTRAYWEFLVHGE
jgi:hypothetical protein